ncbi:MAG TPA: hypothetical protein VFC37_23455 [Terracidiphilus sp.]|jgi:hypothetical protein|nr:hypothetical protein [Terracidiphilus sp.]
MDIKASGVEPETIRLQYKFPFSISLVPYVHKRSLPQVLKKAA